MESANNMCVRFCKWKTNLQAKMVKTNKNVSHAQTNRIPSCIFRGHAFGCRVDFKNQATRKISTQKSGRCNTKLVLITDDQNNQQPSNEHSVCNWCNCDAMCNA